MKKLSDYINNQYISLKGLDDEIVERLSNLDGQMINECDCSGCYSSWDCSTECDTTCPDTGNCITPPTVVDPFETTKLKFFGQPKVYDLLDIHSMCDYNHRFTVEYQRSMKEPVIVSDNCLKSYVLSNKLHDDILSICEEFELLWPVVMFTNIGDIQLFGVRKFGTNGQEGSIKSSLIEAADVLSKLEKRKELKWAQVLDVSIDNLDDLYDFLFTAVFETEKYDKELEEKREKQLKDIVKPTPVNKYIN